MALSRSLSSIRQRVRSLPLWRRLRPHLVGFVGAGIVAVLLALAFVVVWEYSNSPTFCGTRCHTMPPEYAAYTRSLHARVSCVDCHIGRVGFFKSAWLKSGHGGHLTSLIFNDYERPIRIKSLRPARETCELCHWPEAFYEDRVRDIRHYAADEANTASTTFLIMRTGGGTARDGHGNGIHWHIENKVEFVTTDKDKLNIPWVRVTDSQGKTTEYTDVTQKLSPEQLQAAPVQVMDCLDCHNRSAHLFRSPDRALDEALRASQIDPSLPSIKAKGLKLLTAKWASMAEGEAAIKQLEDYYRETYPQVYESKRAAIQQAVNTITDIFQETVFPNQSIGWSTYPDNEGHKEFPGCFRCHDGNHLSPTGDSIRLHCNICHSIPVVLKVGEAPKVEELGKQLLVAQEPPSHLASNFIADHRFQAGDSCVPCHGPVTFGADDSSFCSNSACHGTKWPQVQLDAARKHPIPLEGKHAQAWCNQCHNGESKPAYICAECHERPHEWGNDQCDQCHTFAGWIPVREGVTRPAVQPTESEDTEDEDAGGSTAVQATQPAHTFPQDHGGANKTCSLCHPSEDRKVFNCTTCHNPAPEFLKVHNVDSVDKLAERCATCHPQGKKP